jgi:hypothetical protein
VRASADPGRFPKARNPCKFQAFPSRTKNILRRFECFQRVARQGQARRLTKKLQAVDIMVIASQFGQHDGYRQTF